MRYVLSFLMLSLLLGGCSGDITVDSSEPEVLACRDVSTMQDFQNGDIIIRRGTGMISEKIMENLEEKVPLSHMGIIAEHDGEMMVAQSATRDDSIYYNDLHYATIQSFVEGADSCFCYSVRFQGPDSVRNRIVSVADSLIRKGAVFDFGFDMSEQEHIHCTEFVWLCYVGGTGEDFFPRVEFIREKETIPLNFFLTDAHYKTVYTPADFQAEGE